MKSAWEVHEVQFEFSQVGFEFREVDFECEVDFKLLKSAWEFREFFFFPINLIFFFLEIFIFFFSENEINIRTWTCKSTCLFKARREHYKYGRHIRPAVGLGDFLSACTMGDHDTKQHH